MNQIKNTLARIVLILLGIFVSMIAGALITNLLAGIIRLTVYSSGPAQNSYQCARGVASGYLTIFTGGLLGAVLGWVGVLNHLKSFAVAWGRQARQPANPRKMSLRVLPG